MNKIILIIILSVACFADFRVISEYKREKTQSSFYDYKLQTICKDGYQYTILVMDGAISIVQDFKANAIDDITPVVVRCTDK